jgi:hypothetical protein
MQHHDSTGALQRIEPGAVNWMTAGRGIVHSERRPADLQQRAYDLHGLQLWVAAPETHEAIEPSFQHVGADQIPAATVGGATLRVLVGQAHGLQSPVRAMSPTLFVDYTLAPGARLDLPAADAAPERAVYAVQGQPRLQTEGADALALPLHRLAVLTDTGTVQLQAGDAPARVVLVGGAPVGHRHIWWNFVASRPDLIEQAAEAWARDTLGQVPGETERIPLPAMRWRRS